MITTPDLVVTSLETITAFNVTTGDYMYTLDELQNCSIQNDEEKTPLTGKAGRTLSNLKRNKKMTISGANGMVSGGLLGAQVGSAFENKATPVMWTEYLTVDASHQVTLAHKAIGTSGSEIGKIYVIDANRVASKELTQNTAATGEADFKYETSGNKVTFNAAIAAGTEVVVRYKRKIKADVLTNMSDKYSDKASLYVDALAEDKCANVYRVQFYIPKADFSGTFSLDLGDNQTVHNFEAEALAGVCGGNGSLWTYTVFGVDSVDAE